MDGESSIRSILKKVGDMLSTEKRQDYGHVYASFSHIADLWSLYLKYTGRIPYDDEDLKPKDVAMLMVLFKIAREEHKHKEDNLLDIIGYATLAQVIQETEDFIGSECDYGNISDEGELLQEVENRG